MWEILVKKMMEQIMEQAKKNADPQVLKTLEGEVLVDTNNNGVPDAFDLKIPRQEREQQLIKLRKIMKNKRSKDGSRQAEINRLSNKIDIEAQKGFAENKDIWDYIRIFLLIDVLIAFAIYMYFYLM